MIQTANRSALFANATLIQVARGTDSKARLQNSPVFFIVKKENANA